MYRRAARIAVAAYGRRAHQHVVDQIADAIRAGRGDDARYYEKVLGEVERIRCSEPELFRPN